MHLLFFSVIKLSLFGIIPLSIVFLLRWCFPRLSRSVVCLLWEIALLCLVIPAFLPFSFSLLPNYTQITASLDVTTKQHGVADALPSVLVLLWIIGIAAMFFYQGICALRLRRLTAETVWWQDNLYRGEHISSPFVMGCLHPKIYFPVDFDTSEIALILAHEKIHMTRHDNVKKLFAWIILSVHWFNPLAWVAYILFCEDIELACDEKVIAGADNDLRKRYASAILRQSVGAEHPVVVSFSRSAGVKQRVARVMAYQTAGKVGKALACALCVFFLLFVVVEKADIQREVVHLATVRFMEDYGESYHIKNLHAAVVHTWKDMEGIRYTVSLTCETMPKFDHVNDPALAAEANFGHWEELTTEIVVRKR